MHKTVLSHSLALFVTTTSVISSYCTRPEDIPLVKIGTAGISFHQVSMQYN